MDEVLYYKVKRTDLVNIANAIRIKSEISDELIFPNDYISRIQAIRPRYQYAASTDVKAVNISRTLITAARTG